jgi:hypothetical protein
VCAYVVCCVVQGKKRTCRTKCAGAFIREAQEVTGAKIR